MQNEEEQPIDPYQSTKDMMQEAADRERIKNENYQRFLKELKTEPRFQHFLEQFNPISHENFIQTYAFSKANWLYSAKNIEFTQTYAGLKYKTEADNCLKEILQKQLFDLQCKWRANLITLPTIESVYDFQHWQNHILNCPFLNPITQQELDWYIEYLKTDNTDEYYYGWQDYNHIKGNDNDGDTIPNWYTFYDNRNGGNKGLLLLPDIRGEKEEYYISLTRIENQQKTEALIAASPPPDPRPYLNIELDKIKMRKFIAEIDGDKEALMAFDLWNTMHSQNNTYEDEQAEAAVRTLSEAKEIIPLTTDLYDWRLALIAAAKAYTIKQTIEALPVVYDEYLFRKQAGIAYPPPEYDFGFYKEAKQMVLRGRVLAGEPADFNF